jgi:hypothetical protein
LVLLALYGRFGLEPKHRLAVRKNQ